MEALDYPQSNDVNRPPGPAMAHTIKAALQGKISSLEFMRRLMSHGSLSHTRIGSEHFYGVSDPALIWQVFASNDAIVTRAKQAERITPILGHGVLTSRGEEHRRNRRILQPTFSPRRIQGYGRDMESAALRWSAVWDSRVQGGVNNAVIAKDMSDLTLDIIGRTVFGADLTQESREVSESLNVLLTNFRTMMSPVGQQLLRFPNAKRSEIVGATQQLDRVVDRIVWRKKEALERGQKCEDMLSVLIQTRDPESGEGMTDVELRDEIMTLVLAGHETTANLLAWTFLELSNNPRVRMWLEEELNAVAGKGLIKAEDFPRLARTRAVIAESMRLNPPVPHLFRYTLADMDLAGYRIPRGSTMVVSQYYMHRNPKVWQDPDKFWPQRWLSATGEFDEKAPGQPKGSYFPFGFASRKCIGDRFAVMEATIVLACLGQNWRVTAINPDAVRPIPAITLRPSTGIPAILSRR
jgi:cytochrome P450